MRIERSYLARIVQVYEGPASDIETEPGYNDVIQNYSEADETICGNWTLVSEEIQAVDNDDLTLIVLDTAEEAIK